MAVVVTGVIGLLGLSSVLAYLIGEGRAYLNHKLAAVMVLIGILGLASFNFILPIVENAGSLKLSAGLFVYLILPSFGIVHFLYLARNYLFFDGRGP